VSWLPLSRAERVLLYGFAAASAVGPWVVPDPVAGAVGMAVVMSLTFAVLAQELWAHRFPTPRYLWTAFGVAAGFLAMVAGEALSYAVRGSTMASVPFGLVAFVVMGAELFILSRWALATGPQVASTTAPAVPRPEASVSPMLPP
ncbi:MAG: hypothetical protein L3J97_01275, partial [Thermoplasmata archaeon]|nr:hypothetical protein [Thermoplasmata archaeon]